MGVLEGSGNGCIDERRLSFAQRCRAARGAVKARAIIIANLPESASELIEYWFGAANRTRCQTGLYKVGHMGAVLFLERGNHVRIGKGPNVTRSEGRARGVEFG